MSEHSRTLTEPGFRVGVSRASRLLTLVAVLVVISRCRSCVMVIPCFYNRSSGCGGEAATVVDSGIGVAEAATAAVVVAAAGPRRRWWWWC